MSDNEVIRVMVVDDITETRENLKKLLLFERGVEVVGAAASGEEGIELGKKLKPDVVLMDINMPGIDGISAGEILTREVPGLQIIMMSVQGEADYLRRSMLAGAREFLIKPFSADELITSIRRVNALGRAQRPALAAPAPAATAAPAQGGYAAPVATAAAARQGKIIATFGCKGGVGASSLICNLAVALRELDPTQRIALVDGDFQFGDVGVMLNLNPTQSIIDLTDQQGDLDREYLTETLATHASGVKVLLAPPSPEMADLVQPDQIKKVLIAMRDVYDYILVDTPTSFGEQALAIMDLAETIILITTTEIPAIRNAKLFFEVSEQLNYDENKIMMVLNKYDPRMGITAEAIQASIKHPIVCQISRDERIVNAAINQGLPFVVSQPRSQVSIDVSNLGRRLAGLAIAATPGQPAVPAAAGGRQPAPAAAAAPAPEPKKKSLFSKLFGR